MEKVLNVTFNEENDAYQAVKGLRLLDWQADISLGESYVIKKDENGKSVLKRDNGESMPYTLGGTVLGGLIGLFGGPAGVLIGMGSGMVAGLAGDRLKVKKGDDYIEEVSKNIPNGKTALIAHIWEDWEAPIDIALETFNVEIERMPFDVESEKQFKRRRKKLNNEIKAAKEEWKNSVEELKTKANQKLVELKDRRTQQKEAIKIKTESQIKQISEWIEHNKQQLAEIDTDIKEALNNMSDENRARIEKVKHDVEGKVDQLRQNAEDSKEVIQARLQQLRREKIQRQIDRQEKRLAELRSRLN